MIHFNKKLLCSLAAALVLSSYVTVGQAGVCESISPVGLDVIAHFEDGIPDPNGILHPSVLGTSGPWYAWYPRKRDNINFWDVYSNGVDGINNHADYVYHLNPPQDWREYGCLYIDYLAFSRDHKGEYAPVAGITVYVHDADNTGNSDHNGFHYFGTDYTPSNSRTLLPLPIKEMPNRDQVDQVLIRVHENNFGGVNKSGSMQRTHLYNILLTK